MKTSAVKKIRRRNTAAGSALMESLILLMVLIIVFAFTFHLAPAMRMKMQLTTRNRQNVWRKPPLHYQRYDVDQDHSWTDYNPEANGPIPSPAVGLDTFGQYQAKRPRGDGEALDNLYQRVRPALTHTANPSANDYLARLWNNLPGRKDKLSGQYYGNQLEESTTVRKIFGQMSSRHQVDMAPWVHSQMPAWLIAQRGPMLEINNVFRTELLSIPREYRRMSEEVLHAWFEEKLLHNWNHNNAVHP